jgi:hypothetical protein
MLSLTGGCRGESGWIRYLRGCATVVILLIIAIYSVYQVILKPIAEMDMVPSSEFKGFYLDKSSFSATEPVVYNLIVVSNPTSCFGIVHSDQPQIWKTQPQAPGRFLEVANVDLFPAL